MDIWEILPFLVGLIYFFFRSNKEAEPKRKKTPRPVQTNEGQEQPQNLEDVFRNILREQEAKLKPKVVQVEDKKEENFRDVIKAIHAEKKKVRVHTPVAVVEETVNHHSELEIDLRDAMVYDAIINRPYK
jgi:hypothetical protein